MPTIVLLSALVSPPAAKKQPAAMNPTQTRAKPPRGPSAMKAQMPPSTATLTDSASNSVMASPIDVAGQHIHLNWFVPRRASLSKHYHGFRIDPFVKSSQCQRCGFVAAQQ